MCGIVGYIGKNSKTKKNLIDKMLNSINHRGPDGSSVNIYNNCIIGFNRLSINDLSDTGMQPFEVNDKVVFANGEIYNHLDLKNKFHVSSKLIGDSDIEIIPHIYNELGFDFLNELNIAFGGFTQNLTTSVIEGQILFLSVCIFLLFVLIFKNSMEMLKNL